MADDDTPMTDDDAPAADADTPMDFEDFAADADEALPVAVEDGATNDGKVAADLAPVFEVPVHISAVLGKTSVDVSSLLQLSRGSVLELDRKVGEAIDIYVNNRLVARGEVVVVDERLGVTMTEIIKSGDTG